MKKLIMLILAMVTIGAGSLAFADSRDWGQGIGPGYCLPGNRAANLNLTEEQSETVKTITGNYLKETTPLRNQMLSVGSELRLLWSAASPDREKVLAKQRELSGLQAQIDEISAKYRLDCREILTPEQQSKMVPFMPRMGRGYGPARMHGGRW